MYKKLLFTETPRILHIPTDTYLLAIIEGHPETEAWMMNNFTNIWIDAKSYKDEFVKTSDFFNCPHIIVSGLTLDMAESIKGRFSKLAKLAIEHNSYIYTNLGQRDISAYKIDRGDHNLIIYGYDYENDSFLFADFFNNFITTFWGGKFGCNTMTSEELDNGFKNLPNMSNKEVDYSSSVKFIRFRKEVDYCFSIEKVIRETTKFLEGTNPYVDFPDILIDMHFYFLDTTDTSILYGVKAIDFVMEMVSRLECNRIRPLSLLLSYTRMWEARLNYLEREKYLVKKSVRHGNIQRLLNLCNANLYKYCVILLRQKEGTLESRNKLKENLKYYKNGMEMFLEDIVKELEKH